MHGQKNIKFLKLFIFTGAVNHWQKLLYLANTLLMLADGFLPYTSCY